MNNLTPNKSFSEISNDPLTPTIFHESWWLDIATESRYEVAEVIKDGKVIGRQPYFYYPQKLPGMKVIGLPALTHFLGPAVVDCGGKPSVKFSHRLVVTGELISKLPKVSSIYVKCHRDITDVIAFQTAGFRAGVQYTGEIHPQPLDTLWANLRDKTRTLIRRARKEYNVTIGIDPDVFMQFYAESIYKVKGIPNVFNINVHTKLIQACMERSRGKIYEARDQNGVLAAAIFCAWDNVSSYPLLFCREPNAHWGATGMLLWEAITDALNHNLIFDFDGFASEASVRAANNFTATIVPRYIATRESYPMKMYRAVQQIGIKQQYYF